MSFSIVLPNRADSQAALQAKRFGEAKAPPPPPPEGVPEKFVQVWASLPGCCRNFYLNPGQGCCAGKSEPSPGMMKTKPAQSPCPITQNGHRADGIHVNSTQKVKKPGIIAAFFGFFKALLVGFWKDIKRIFSGAQSD